MAKTTYAAGLQFIVSTSEQPLSGENRRAVTSHATRAQWKQRKTVELRSWIDPDRNLVVGKGRNKTRPESGRKPAPPVPIPTPKRVGGVFSALQLPPGIEPSMIQDLVKLIDLDKIGAYPYDVCLRVHPVERGWFPYMISDICCIHSMMFSVGAYADGVGAVLPLHDAQISRPTAFHYSRTLQLLQARIKAFEQGQRDLVLDDATIIVIVNLATAAELTGDFATAKTHVDGLMKIVSLRGGLRSLTAHNNLQVKVCRADLGLALRSGTRAHLFREGLTWDCFIADRGLMTCNHPPHEGSIRAFVDGALDPKLRNSWRDLHTFSCLTNLAYQTTRKFSPEIYNEMTISILYRLAHLRFDDGRRYLLQEAIRTGLLAFCSTIFLTRQFLQQPYEHLVNLFSLALSKLCDSDSSITRVPPQIIFWLMILYHLVAYKEPAPGDWQSLWLAKAISLNGVQTWPQAQTILRSIMWVDFVHDAPGKKIFSAAISSSLEA